MSDWHEGLHPIQIQAIETSKQRSKILARLDENLPALIPAECVWLDLDITTVNKPSVYDPQRPGENDRTYFFRQKRADRIQRMAREALSGINLSVLAPIGDKVKSSIADLSSVNYWQRRIDAAKGRE